MGEVTRRSVLKSAVTGAAALSAIPVMAQDAKQERWGDIPDFPEKTPPLETKLVKKFVIAGHGNLTYVKEMLEAYPTLLNACHDWGTGDFETALEGAGHMGNTEIAEFLVSKGARMNIFCAAMLGHLAFVKSAIDAHPGLKDSKGPHGLTLLHHAKAGGERSKAVLEYVEKLG